MLAAILRPLSGQHNELAPEIDLGPLEMPDFIATLACEQQQTHDVAKAVIAKATPQRP